MARKKVILEEGGLNSGLNPKEKKTLLLYRWVREQRNLIWRVQERTISTSKNSDGLAGTTL